MKKILLKTFLLTSLVFPMLLSLAIFSIGYAKADTAINVSVCQIMNTPTISVDNTGTSLNISGNSGEQTLVTEHLFRDSNEVANFNTDMQGNYSISTDLLIGSHNYMIKSIDGCNTTKTSETLTVSHSGGLGGIIEVIRNTFFSQINTINSPINETSKVLTNMSGTTS